MLKLTASVERPTQKVFAAKCSPKNPKRRRPPQRRRLPLRRPPLDLLMQSLQPLDESLRQLDKPPLLPLHQSQQLAPQRSQPKR